MSANISCPDRFPVPSFYTCFINTPGVFIFSTFIVIHIILFLPLCIFILYLGHQRLQKRSTSSPISHSDCLTFHLVIIELIGIVGGVVSFCGNCIKNSNIFIIGMVIFFLTSYGQLFFHILTCVERYLAVVHPIIYLSLRNGRGIRIRNIIIGCTWLLCIVGLVFETVASNIFLNIFVLALSTTIISICSLSVLHVLIRPGPGDRGESRERIDQSKRRAFLTIMAILGIMILRLSFDLIWVGLDVDGTGTQCLITSCLIWIHVPSSLVLPLLFLQKAGKLEFCKK